MQYTIEVVISKLASFVPTEEEENVSALYAIFDGFSELANRQLAAPAMLDLLERFPEGAFGCPGPLVHELERIEGYQALLTSSLRRQPTDLTVWMANRVLNSKKQVSEREFWLNALTQASIHPKASTFAQESANNFVELHLGRRHG